MNFAALLPKGATAVPTVCAANEVLKFATVNGAKALEFPDSGEIAPGKKADIAILDLNRPEFYPRVKQSSLTAELCLKTDICPMWTRRRYTQRCRKQPTE